MTATTQEVLTAEYARLEIGDLLRTGRRRLAAKRNAEAAKAAEAARVLAAEAARDRAGYVTAAFRTIPTVLAPLATFAEDREVLTVTLALPGLEPAYCRFSLKSRAYDDVPAVWVREGERANWWVSTYELIDGDYRGVAVYADTLAEALALAEEAAATCVRYAAWLADRM